jgi:uncharacterized transporter YbjL
MRNVWVDGLSGSWDGCPRGSCAERRRSSWPGAWKSRISRHSIGAAGVLFAGLLLGQTSLHIDQNIVEFLRDFGLILFVYTVGLQVGPSFFSSLKRRGFRLNLLASTIVLLGGLMVEGRPGGASHERE